ncbi:class-II aminoacyl-tRNA synthetase family protein [Desulfocurvus sp. DL9XJH121]
MPDAITVRVQRPFAGHGLGQVIYSASFIDPAVTDVAYEDGTWIFTLDAPVAEEKLLGGLETLVGRYQDVVPDTVTPVFAVTPPEDAVWPARPASGGGTAPIQEIHPGLFIWREPVSVLLRFLDDMVLRRFARFFGASEEIYPNCIPVDGLGRANHFSSFPEHLHFLAHLPQDLEILDEFAENAKGVTSWNKVDIPAPAQARLVNNPSTCYHCYAARENTTLEANTALTVITKCHRFEAANHKEYGRLLEFSMREVVFLGEPDYIRDCRAKTLDLVQALAEDWTLYGELTASNDPFFTNDYKAKSAQQHRLAMKMEYRMLIPGKDKRLAIMSSNLHGPTFSKAFNITMGGRLINTGCLGFGLERLALAILAQHGMDPAAWPRGLREDYEAWRSGDPLQG